MRIVGRSERPACTFYTCGACGHTTAVPQAGAKKP